MKKLYSLLLSSLISGKIFAANVTIIQSTNAAWTADTLWKFVATGMGHNATIQQDTILDNTNFFATTDVLVTPVYDINLTPARIANIILFMQTGKGVYIQSEYDCANFIGNAAYQSIVTTLGGTYNWNGTVAGVLAPMNVTGVLGTTPNVIPPLSYFWYGCATNGCYNMEPFLEYQGQYFGITFCPPQNGVGRVMTTSDQDWILQLTSLPLMENMLTLLLSPPGNCGMSASSISLGNDTTLCTGDHLLLGAGITGTNFLWSNGATTNVILVDTTAAYWVQVTTGTCSTADTINVTFNPCNVPSANFTAVDSLCPGTCVDFTNLSVNATSYQWFFAGANPAVSTDANPSVICYNTSGSYDVTLIAINALGSDTLLIPNYISVYPSPPPQGISQSGDTLFANAGAVSYQWYHGGNLIPGATDYFYVADASGDFNVVATDANGCEVEAAIFDVVASVQSTVATMQVDIYPNPVKGKLYVKCNTLNGAAVIITVYNVLGVAVQSEIKNQKSEMIVDVSELSKGIYYLEINTTQKVLRTKFIKQ